MKTKQPMKRWQKVVLVLLLLLLVGGGGVYGLANHYLGQINRPDQSQEEIVPPEEETFGDASEEPVEDVPAQPEPEPEPAPEVDRLQPIDCSDLINIMLVGQDRRAGQGRQRSDAMILCSINPSTGQVALISFMRDLYVSLPGGYSNNRMNAAYAFGGFKLLDATLLENFGIPVDANIEVDFTAFEAVINKLGGIDVEMSAAEARYMGSGYKTGMNHLNGAQALNFARIRKLDSDFSRTERQREVLMAVFQKIRGQSLPQLLDTAQALLPYLTTDMSNGEMIQLATRLFPLLTSADIKSCRIPAEGTYRSASIRGMSVLVPDLRANRDKLQNGYLPLSH